MPDDKTDIQEAEESILRNAASSVQSYEVDGEKVTNKDPVKQLDALDRLKAARSARHPLSAVRFWHLPGSSGAR